MNKRVQIFRYIIFDFLTAGISWTIFYIFRKLFIEPNRFGYYVPLNLNLKFLLSLIIIPFFWVALYYFTGYYKEVLRKSRFDDAIRTFLQVLAGVLIIFFFLILDDYISSYKNYYLLFGILFGMQFVFTLIPRYLLTSITLRRLRQGKIGFNTIILGRREQANRIFKELNEKGNPTGNFLIGYVNNDQEADPILLNQIPWLGNIENLENIVKEHQVDEVILALEPSGYDEANQIINKLGLSKVIIRIIPEMYTLLSGRVRMDHLDGTSLIQLSHNLMPQWQENIKELIDIAGSVFALIISSPLIILIAIGIKITSPGPIIYSHERIGRFGKPFRIYKFRSMYIDAEIKGPELSSRNDKRLTKFGWILRKYRLDEIPNFFNVLKGDMSLVGPRPEREFYTKQIIEKAPHYIHIQKVKPGITSWGQVKYGYAENVDQMVKRLDYDLMYVENMSLFVDIKILFYTFLTIIRGRGI
jgi:exopolysaccharide biosynthesis polyprenyl glycosylphosphotransferase